MQQLDDLFILDCKFGCDRGWPRMSSSASRVSWLWAVPRSAPRGTAALRARKSVAGSRVVTFTRERWELYRQMSIVRAMPLPSNGATSEKSNLYPSGESFG